MNCMPPDELQLAKKEQASKTIDTLVVCYSPVSDFGKWYVIGAISQWVFLEWYGNCALLHVASQGLRQTHPSHLSSLQQDIEAMNHEERLGYSLGFTFAVPATIAAECLLFSWLGVVPYLALKIVTTIGGYKQCQQRAKRQIKEKLLT